MNAGKKAACGGRTMAELERTATMLRLIAHPFRLKLLELLRDRPKAPVHDLADAVGLAPAATSQHLNHMRRLGLVAADRRGREVRYAIGDRRVLKILRCACAGDGEDGGGTR